MTLGVALEGSFALGGSQRGWETPPPFTTTISKKAKYLTLPPPAFLDHSKILPEKHRLKTVLKNQHKKPNALLVASARDAVTSVVSRRGAAEAVKLVAGKKRAGEAGRLEKSCYTSAKRPRSNRKQQAIASQVPGAHVVHGDGVAVMGGEDFPVRGLARHRASGVGGGMLDDEGDPPSHTGMGQEGMRFGIDMEDDEEREQKDEAAKELTALGFSLSQGVSGMSQEIL